MSLTPFYHILTKEGKKSQVSGSRRWALRWDARGNVIPSWKIGVKTDQTEYMKNSICLLQKGILEQLCHASAPLGEHFLLRFILIVQLCVLLLFF